MMRQFKIVLFLMMLALIVSSCIKPYEPSIDSKEINKFVVSGQITDRGGDQIISISMTSAIKLPKTKPVKGCSVRILDEKGHVFPMGDSGDGNYHVWIENSYLIQGAAFKIDIVTSDGIKITSDFDRISESSPVDSIYYLLKDLPTTDPKVFVKGIQFYCDLKGKSTDSRFYRFEAIETWEYHADYPLEMWYDGAQFHQEYPPDYSKFKCWNTSLVKEIYTLSTENLVGNKYHMFPVNFTDNHTSRLVWGYSLLINQYALSQEAYTYWDQLRINSSAGGGLFNKQPMAIKGNLHNLSNPDQDVLGFFGVSSMKSKRIFVRNVENLNLEYLSGCTPEAPSPLGLDYYPTPVYLLSDPEKGMLVLNHECVNCLTLGGTNIKPDFWPY